VFKSKSAGHLKLVANDDEHDVDLVLMKMAKKSVAESKIRTHMTLEYLCRMLL